MSEFVVSNKTVKDKHMSDVVGSGHAASEVVSSWKILCFCLMMNMACSFAKALLNVKLILFYVARERVSVQS